jgi:DNA sulfur modification protein DndD
MSTSLTILGWSVQGLRCPDHDISFEKNENEVYKISLVQMPNGTGKTTTLKLLRAALGGPSMSTTSFDKPNSFKKHPDTATGYFELKLRHSNRRLTIIIEFDFTQDKEIPAYKTTSTLGTDTGFNLPDELIPFLKPEFVKLLIFDGELATQLLNPHYTNAQDAIEVLYQLPVLLQMKDRVKNYWQTIADQSGSSGGNKERSRRQTRVDQLKEHLFKVEQSKKNDEDKLEKITAKLKELQQRFSEEIKKTHFIFYI